MKFDESAGFNGRLVFGATKISSQVEKRKEKKRKMDVGRRRRGRKFKLNKPPVIIETFEGDRWYLSNKCDCKNIFQKLFYYILKIKLHIMFHKLFTNDTIINRIYRAVLLVGIPTKYLGNNLKFVAVPTELRGNLH